MIEAGKDAILVMYDGNRTYLITTQEALVKGDDAKAFTLKIAQALYKHTTPDTPPAAPAGSGAATPSAGASTPAVPRRPQLAERLAPASSPAAG